MMKALRLVKVCLKNISSPQFHGYPNSSSTGLHTSSMKSPSPPLETTSSWSKSTQPASAIQTIRSTKAYTSRPLQ